MQTSVKGKKGQRIIVSSLRGFGETSLWPGMKGYRSHKAAAANHSSALTPPYPCPSQYVVKQNMWPDVIGFHAPIPLH